MKEKTYIHLRIEKEFKKELEKEAKEKKLSLTAYIRMILIERGK